MNKESLDAYMTKQVARKVPAITDHPITVQDEINFMIAGDRETIIRCSGCDNVLLVINSIVYGLKFKINDEEYILNLKARKLYNKQFIGTRLAPLYDAALDLMCIEKYEGNDPCTLKILESGGIEV